MTSDSHDTHIFRSKKLSSMKDIFFSSFFYILFFHVVPWGAWVPWTILTLGMLKTDTEKSNIHLTSWAHSTCPPPRRGAWVSISFLRNSSGSEWKMIPQKVSLCSKEKRKRKYFLFWLGKFWNSEIQEFQKF